MIQTFITREYYRTPGGIHIIQEAVVVKHIVAWNVKGDREQACMFLRERFESMKNEIPQILSIETGINNPSEFANRDFVLITTHHSFDDLYGYQDHEYHQQIKRDVSPYLQDRACIDFEVS
jgi:hypothetical protein